ncbi:helix-turn-helix domain-containing protein [Peptostreptococcus faecalis]|uniref:helix-turn-helix domain-containing protein n=1 Tax=Peptostreptococcus faecalis TaxID=2045015 RepID=UPI000C7BFA44|nr:helix-turn-helix domain-containing protein [Peptostreptococcus faecalis]
MNNIKSSVLDRLKIITKNKRMTIAELERKANVGHGTIRNWDKSLPSADKLYSVANVLGVSMEYIITGKDSLTDKIDIIAREIVGLDEEKLKIIVDLVKILR